MYILGKPCTLPLPRAQLLQAAGLDDLPPLMIPATEVFRALAAEVRVAKRDGRDPFLDVDLTADAFRPLWMPAEAVASDSGQSWNPDVRRSTATASSSSRCTGATVPP